MEYLKLNLKTTYNSINSFANPPFRAEAKICQTTNRIRHDMERRKMQLYENGQLVKTRIYCGMYEKETLADSAVKEFCYISGGGGVTAVLINQDMYYLRRDVQGTITGLVNQNDSIVEEYSYDAWGRRRNPANWTYDSVPQPQYMHRGYTFHEMLDEFGLINMNGRCYDPVVGRFLSPDIVVQNTNNTQCYNRYSYAINNPLKYSDPGGWSWAPIQAANHANMMSNTMKLRLFNQFQPSGIRSGSSSRGSGFGFGPNGILFQNTEATIEMELAAIDNLLRNVFGMAGLFGNPGEKAGAEDFCDPPELGSTVILQNIQDFKGCKGLTLCDLTILPPLNGKAGRIGIHISFVYDAGSQGESNKLFHFNQLIIKDGLKKEDGEYNPLYGEKSMTTKASFKNGKYNLGTQYITFIDRPSYYFAVGDDDIGFTDPTPANKEISGNITLLGKNREILFEFFWSYQIAQFGNGPYDWKVDNFFYK